MKINLPLTALTAAVAALSYLAVPAAADQWDKQTILTFNNPVEVPGHVLLPGTYVFRLADLSSDRNVVEVFRQDKNGMDHLVTIKHVAAAWTPKEHKNPKVTFSERHSNTPEAINSWYYPGSHRGWQFIYRKGQNLQPTTTAKLNPPAHQR
jgi:hypothetical protein